MDAGNYFVEVGDSSRNLTQKVSLPVASWFETIPFMNEQTDMTSVETAPDLALNKRAFASSVNGANAAARAFDDNIKTRWQAAGKDGEWLAVDLGAPQRIGRVFLNWETAGANAYRIEVSDDGDDWREVYATDKSEGGEEEVTFAPATARYVRMLASSARPNSGFLCSISRCARRRIKSFGFFGLHKLNVALRICICPHTGLPCPQRWSCIKFRQL